MRNKYSTAVSGQIGEKQPPTSHGRWLFWVLLRPEKHWEVQTYVFVVFPFLQGALSFPKKKTQTSHGNLQFETHFFCVFLVPQSFYRKIRGVKKTFASSTIHKHTRIFWSYKKGELHLSRSEGFLFQFPSRGWFAPNLCSKLRQS